MNSSREKLNSSEERKPTNVSAIYFCGAFVVVLFAFVGYTFVNGSIFRIVNGIDDCGNICGKDNPGLAVDTCGSPDKRQLPFTLVKITKDKYHPNVTYSHSTCVKSCSDFPGYKEIANRCFFMEKDKDIEDVDFTSFAQQVISDLTLTWYHIAATCLVALVFSYILLILFRYCIKYIIWIIYIGLVILFVIGAIGCLVLYSAAKSSDKQEERDGAFVLLIGAGIMFLIACVLALVLYFFRKRIRLVVQIFKEASKALNDVPLIIAEPLLTFIALGFTFVSFLYFAMIIESSGSLEKTVLGDGTSVALYVKNTVMSAAHYVNLVAFLWFVSFIVGCQNFVIAGTVSQWFFTRDKTKLDSPISRAFSYLLKFHLGSICLGSILITIVKIIRMIVETIEKNARESGNPAAKILAACCVCIMDMLEEFLQYLMRNAYIIVAMDGTPLITSGKKAFNLLKAHLLDVIALNKFGDFVLFLGRIFVVLIAGFVCYEMIGKNEAIHYPAVPIVISIIFAYLIVDCFMVVYEMTVDTIFICFCEDCEQNDGQGRPYFMSSKMMQVMQELKGAAGGEFNFGGQGGQPNVEAGQRPMLQPNAPGWNVLQ